jgi:hypothetical protein
MPADKVDDATRGWFRSSDRQGKALIHFDGDEAKELVYGELDGMAIFEGDIALGTLESINYARDQHEYIPQGIARKGDEFRWPDGVIPYQIKTNFPQPERITQAIDHWRTNTKLTFVERNGANMMQYPDYVAFEDHGACWSEVGRKKGGQVISIGPNCSVGAAIHEIGHSAGLWHEQSRSDRDKYIMVLDANINPSDRHNFDQHIEDGTDLGAYDYGSIMHYPTHAFSRNGQPTILPKQGVAIGQRTSLSPGDLEAIRAIYPELYP